MAVFGGVQAQRAARVGAREPPAGGDQVRAVPELPAPAAERHPAGRQRIQAVGELEAVNGRHVSPNASVPGMPTRLFPMLSAADFEASLRFYRDLLGGVEAYRFPEDDPAFVTLRYGDSELGIGAMRGRRCTASRSVPRPVTGSNSACTSSTSTRPSPPPAAPVSGSCSSPPISRGASASPISPTPTATL